MLTCRHDGDGRGGCRHPKAERPWSYLIISALDAERSHRSHGPGQRDDVAARPRRGVRRTCRAARGRQTPGPSVTADESARACPACGVFASRVRGPAVTRPRDLPYGDSGPEFLWHKRRWFCREPRCPRRSFTEQIAQIPAGARLTGRLRGAAGRRVRDASPAHDHEQSRLYFLYLNYSPPEPAGGDRRAGSAGANHLSAGPRPATGCAEYSCSYQDVSPLAAESASPWTKPVPSRTETGGTSCCRTTALHSYGGAPPTSSRGRRRPRQSG
ncbi:transposase family protein [Streptomyces sp. NWU339]|uniref:transposase family protein n=1 Tax=Streptomyces sp. NWU339 TaxID=2185284 RepID=UPI0035C850CE